MSKIEQVWAQILKHEGKFFKTKKGLIFSYKIKNEAIIPQYHVNWDPNKTSEIYGEGFRIKKSDVEKAVKRTPTKKVTDLNDIVVRPTHLWGILNDPRILEKI